MSNTRKEIQPSNPYSSFSFLNILKNLLTSKPTCQAQHDANQYLSECDSESDIVDKLKQIIREKNPDILELFLRGMKKKNITEIALRSPFDFGGKVNTLSFCVDIKFPSLLAIMLHYGANPNAKTWLSEGKEKYVDCPPLLSALILESKAAVRLLVIYGASLDKIDFDELVPQLQKFKLSDYQKYLYNEVTLEIKKIRLLESQAQVFERNKNFKAAFECYKKIGDYNIKLASHCKYECRDNITSRRKLTNFYIRRSLLPYARSLYCIEKHLENSSLNPNESADLQLKIGVFYKEMLKAADPIIDHGFLNEKMQPIIDSWERITQLFQQQPSCFEDYDPDLSDKENNENLLCQRKYIEKTTDNVEETYSLLKCR